MFLWISDAFLLYRAWVIWVHLRKYTIVPALAFLTSFITGVIWLKQAVPQTSSGELRIDPSGLSFELEKAVVRWVPALGFSCGLDALTTGMIAGRLIYCHIKQKKRTASSSAAIYLPVATIFIESAALSLISKILQLSIQSLGTNPIVVPLCTISSNLIVLRKALGADVSQMVAKGEKTLSTLRFQRPDARPTATGNIPGGFESYLIQTIGGHAIGDFGSLGQVEAETPVCCKEIQTEIEAQTTVHARSPQSSRFSCGSSVQLQRDNIATSDRG